MEVEGVLTQACLAISVLAVKRKTDRVHNGNTRKLVTKGKTIISPKSYNLYFKANIMKSIPSSKNIGKLVVF